MEKGRIIFESSDTTLNEGFEWAKKQALFYSHENDLVGDWYEAALPQRQAFCIRDIAHQAMGAEALGLRGHTKNMLLRFVQNIAESRQFCTFWEIDKDYRPCPVDYASDDDFWYNLPANFELLDVCFRMFMLTGDLDYINSIDFTHFYELTLDNYVKEWDRNGDGILERKAAGGRKGIPSYCENTELNQADTVIDMLASQIRGYFSVAQLYKYKGDQEMAQVCRERGQEIQKILNSQWWDSEKEMFYQARDRENNLFHSTVIGHVLALSYYDVITDSDKKELHLNRLNQEAIDPGINVESLSYYPELFYRSGKPELAYNWLKELINPDLHRREYPEVSYAVVGNYIYGLAGIKVDAMEKNIEIAPNLPIDLEWFSIDNYPLLDGEADIRFDKGVIEFTNRSKQQINVNGVSINPGEKATV